ncbi:MAG: hypothetical protein COT73_07150, partial [Bdellovibrio sp. CG10_big_fil_rev_8_21_14_0_10_47_8]
MLKRALVSLNCNWEGKMTLQTRKHFGQILILISTLVTSYLGSSQAWADEPQEQVSQQLERTMQTGNTLQGQLIKNRYR